MPLYDISLPISESLVVWPGDSGVSLNKVAELERGHIATVTRIVIGAHTGTHVDAPAHFLRGGATVEQLALDVLIGPAQVIKAQENDRLSANVLEGLTIPPGTERLLLRTRNSDLWARGEFDAPFIEDFVAITEDGARWLVERGVRLVGVDYLSVAPYSDLVAPHRTLLEAGVILVEGLDLSGVPAGPYRLVCLPLRIEGAEGAPSRAILMER